MVKRKFEKSFLIIVILALQIIFFSGFITRVMTTLYLDNFESYVTTQVAKRAYAVWEDGAQLEISLDEKSGENNSRGMRIDILGPNKMDGSKTGSVFHSLPLLQRNWTGASGIRFWVKNTDKSDLWLTLNFKEAYNEYWAIRHGAEYLLEADGKPLFQEECFYGNIRIPAEFTGKVIVPIESFSVPEWNTARGDEILQLNDIESYALGITLDDKYPLTFYIDTFEVFISSEPFTFIQGVRQIQIPDSGQLNEFYKIKTTGKNEYVNGSSVTWMVESALNTLVRIEEDGSLIIPSGSKDETITIFFNSDIPMIDQRVGYNVRLFHPENLANREINEETNNVPSALLSKTTPYDQFSQEFEAWAREYRPLFVLISVGLVLLFIFILSTFQRKLK